MVLQPATMLTIAQIVLGFVEMVLPTGNSDVMTET